MRHDPARLKLASYPFRCRIRVLWADVDGLRHVNNVAISRYLEEARVGLSLAIFGETMVLRPSGERNLLARLGIDYLAECLYPAEIEVGTSVGRIGRTSFAEAAAVFQDGRCVALADAVIVHAMGDGPAPLSDDQKRGLEAYRTGAPPSI